MRRESAAGADIAVRAVVAGAAAFMVGIGCWAWWSPQAFARWAHWPVHVHFIRDGAVFQITIGLMMLFALRWRDVLAVVLAGFTLANGLHALNHFLDLHVGGRAADPWILLGVAALGLAAWGARMRRLRVRRRHRRP
ncbi:hypothetical protein ACFPZ0_13520 [Streptomonospora nanhaiensis]|uniref:Uncharacterized protein n=1 Tax=Streptomonospora nanhaiensis TaxID=1323731 RepID=A0A853BI17_9ACTN|nr:hypothetical protein [Streptomonospora nanhaiensis]MBV2366423.1 hypothetical protein [Streptomonospora nanhaiensis]MBX9389966.1 hypothetical protein [Streptomonospora nanhaiensis]NYI94242.1 hypothetical protein [Streptomonospora nanhaiensis]